MVLHRISIHLCTYMYVAMMANKNVLFVTFIGNYKHMKSQFSSKFIAFTPRSGAYSTSRFDIHNEDNDTINCLTPCTCMWGNTVHWWLQCTCIEVLVPLSLMVESWSDVSCSTVWHASLGWGVPLLCWAPHFHHPGPAAHEETPSADEDTPPYLYDFPAEQMGLYYWLMTIKFPISTKT